MTPVLNESLKFINSTRNEIEKKFKEDIENVKANDREASQPIYDAIVNSDINESEQPQPKQEDKDNIV